METAALSTEITYLAWGVVLVFAQLLLQANTAVLESGPAYAFGPRDEGRRPQGTLAKRSDRALRNALETFPFFIALALALEVSGRTGGYGATGAALWFWARVVYVPLLLVGVPYLRTIVWLVSIVGLGMMLVRLLS